MTTSTMRRVTGSGLVLLAAMAIGSSDAGAAAGENGFAYLKVGVGTDAAGMGNAYVSGVSDATSTYWNPAGLPRANGFDLVLQHNAFIADLRTEYAGFAWSVGERHGFGLSFNGLFTDDLEGRDENGNITGRVGYNDLAFTLGYGLRLGDALTLGVTGSYLREYIGDPGATEDHIADGLVGSVGFQYVTGVVSVGAVVQNLGSDFSFNSVESVSQSGTGAPVGGDPFTLPQTVQGGITLRPARTTTGSGLELAVEARQVINEDDVNVLLGGRYFYQDFAALSVGYKTGLDTEDLSFGLMLRKQAVRFGYAFVPFKDDLGNSHRIQLGLHFM